MSEKRNKRNRRNRKNLMSDSEKELWKKAFMKFGKSTTVSIAYKRRLIELYEEKHYGI